jgi:hypothetical protein
MLVTWIKGSRSKGFAGVRNTTGARMQNWKAYLLFRVDNWGSAVIGSHSVRVSTHSVSINQLGSRFSLCEVGCSQQEESEQAGRSLWLESETRYYQPVFIPDDCDIF